MEFVFFLGGRGGGPCSANLSLDMFHYDFCRSWKMFGLTEEPPPLTEEEKSKLEHEWRNEGIWTDPLTVDEYKSFDKITGIMKRTDKK